MARGYVTKRQVHDPHPNPHYKAWMQNLLSSTDSSSRMTRRFLLSHVHRSARSFAAWCHRAWMQNLLSSTDSSSRMTRRFLLSHVRRSARSFAAWCRTLYFVFRFRNRRLFLLLSQLFGCEFLFCGVGLEFIAIASAKSLI